MAFAVRLACVRVESTAFGFGFGWERVAARVGAVPERELERRLREYETSSERITRPLLSAPAPTTPMYSTVIIECGVDAEAASG